jgi:RNA polymerase sigma-70 factor (ECF subfamily)
MSPRDPTLAAAPPVGARLDRESAGWLRALAGAGAERDEAIARLHELLLRVARGEVRRRGRQLRIDGPELDDLAHQAVADALLSITARLDRFRGESRFTTWAYAFVIFEVSKKLGRHFWRRPSVSLDAEDWERLPDRFGFDAAEAAASHELLDALHRAIDEVLTERQRHVFAAIVLNGVPADALVVELDTNRNAIYKTLFDARRKLRAALVAEGHLDEEASQ